MYRSTVDLCSCKCVNIRFVPKYLAEQVNKKISLSAYDNDDLSMFNEFMSSGLVGNPPIVNETISGIINCLYKPGEYTFNENNILMRGKPVMSINIDVDDDDDSCTTVTVVCDEGCVNPVLDRNRSIRQAVSSWLIDTLIKRLDEGLVIRTQFFEDCWLHV